MAKTVKIKSKLKDTKKKYLRMSVISMLVSFIMLVLAIYISVKTDIPSMLSIVLTVIGVILICMCLLYSKKYNITKAGVQGEKETLCFLKDLPSDFTVISNPVIKEKDKEFELDFLIIGSEGVFIIETKNYSGIVRGSTSDYNWKQIKILKNNNEREKTVKNPVKQAEYQMRKLKRLFKEINVSANIYPVVYFANENVTLEYTVDEEAPVFVIKNKEMLFDYITSNDGKKTVNSFERSRIINYFKDGTYPKKQNEEESK